MYVTVKENFTDYTIRYMKHTMISGGDCQLSWHFNRASHFLILVHPAKMICGLESNMVPWISENGERLLEEHIMEEDGIWLYVVQEREFLAKKNKCILPKTSITAGIPYRITVYPCQIQEGNWDIYQVPNNANVDVIPVQVLAELMYKNPFLTKKTLCMFRVRFEVSRLEGVLRYKPSCSRCQFPVSVESMKAARDGWLHVWLPKGEELKLVVAPEYKEYYNIKMVQD